MSAIGWAVLVFELLVFALGLVFKVQAAAWCALAGIAVFFFVVVYRTPSPLSGRLVNWILFTLSLLLNMIAAILLVLAVT